LPGVVKRAANGRGQRLVMPSDPWPVRSRWRIPSAFDLPMSAWREPLSWRRPVWLVVVTLLLLCYPNSSTTESVSLARPTPGDAAAVLLILVSGWQLLRPENLARLRTPWLLPPLGFALAASVSTLFSHDPVLSAAGLIRVLELFVLVPVAAFVAVRDRRDMMIALTAVIGMAVLEAAVGLYQFLTGSGAGFGAQDIRAVGTFGIGDQLAMAATSAIGMILCLAAAMIMHGRARFWSLVAAGFLVAALAASLSRGSLLAAGVATVVMATAAGFRRLFILLIVVAVGAILAFGVVGASNSVIAERFGTITSAGSTPDRSVHDRYDLWSAAVSMWQTSPVTGIGVKNFSLFRDGEAPLSLSSGSDAASDGRYVRVQLLSPHNEYLLILAEQGLLGFVALAGLGFVFVLGPLVRLRVATAPRDRWICLGLFGLGVRHLIDFAYGDVAGSSALLLAILFGLAMRCAAGSRAELG
jgi:O-antigen ligase